MIIPYDFINFLVPLCQVHPGWYFLANNALVPVSWVYMYVGVTASSLHQIFNPDGIEISNLVSLICAGVALIVFTLFIILCA